MPESVPMARQALDKVARMALPSVESLLQAATLLGPAEPEAIPHGDLHSATCWRTALEP